ncbi:hypothetical protein BDV33DRAFT_186016 [Aspergillus novoparasiticus]|uniref:Uncharacterized protein n=1 Tax=Aspergillus novoparasiticus TaxID=986946 RepID=A0A5N6E6H0_9EURO|nr:hypothetical protein BDV33DRAFT_186016 [Aspergillus novoparasiticus]
MSLVEIETVTLRPFSSVPHKGQYGHIISDPDKSNPARPRFERPLDTIHSFEQRITKSQGGIPQKVHGSD